MAHKLTLTGVATSALRPVGDIYSFDMTQTSGTIPKGLPAPENPIVYTVFLNKKQWTKLGLKAKALQTTKIMVQGEPTLDIPIDDCPGEIGVLCMKIELIPAKDAPQPAAVSNGGIHEPAKSIVLASAAPEMVSLPEMELAMQQVAAAVATYQLMDTSKIIIPEEFQHSPPRRAKVIAKIKAIQDRGNVGEPLIIDPVTNVLQDGYSWYVAALELGMNQVYIDFKRP